MENSFEKFNSGRETEPSKAIENPFAPTETWEEHLKKAELLVSWEKNKANSDKSGINPLTRLFERGRAKVPLENQAKYQKSKNILKKLISGAALSLSEKAESGRDGILYDWHGYQLKPDHCYRKIGPDALKHYRESGFIDNDINLETMTRQDGSKIRGGNVETVDWYLGGTTPRYGDILIECPASEEYFMAVGRPGDSVNMTTDPDVLHMYSSGIADPIPVSEVKLINESGEAKPLL